MMKLDRILTDKDNTAEIAEAEAGFVLRMKPKTFTGKHSAEIAYDKDFDEMCIAITRNLKMQVDGMTVLRFYNAYEHLLTESKERKKRMARIKRH